MSPFNTTLSRRQFSGGAAGLATLFATGCGFLLYPERRGRMGGRIDLPVLIVDLLWFLPGLVPGLICLVVDFSSGCIYGGSGYAGTTPPLPSPLERATLEVELDGEVVATALVQPDGSTLLQWTQVIDAQTLHEKAHLVVRGTDGAEARAPLHHLVSARSGS
jgi:hypothetical protein